MSKLPLILLLLALIVGTVWLVRTRMTGPGATQKLQVTASFYPLYFFASEIGGSHVQVKNITPAGAEPHDYEPSTQDIVDIQNSKLLILNGAVEAWGDKIKQNLQGKQTKILEVGQGIINRTVVEDGQTVTDPHIWLDPVLAKAIAIKIANTLSQIDPTNTSDYQKNLTTVSQKLDQLDQDYRTGLASCQDKNIITSHAAFGYLGAQYGLIQVPIAGLSPDAEPSIKQLADISDFAKAHNIKYIFFEALVSPKLSQSLAQQVGAQTLVLDPLEGLTQDQMAAGQNYFTVMQRNLQNLRTALSCQ